MGRLSDITMGKYNIKIEEKDPTKKALLQAYCDVFVNDKNNNKYITVSNNNLYMHNRKIILYSPNTTTQKIFKIEGKYLPQRQDLHRTIQQKIEKFFCIKTDIPTIFVSNISQNALTIQKILNNLPEYKYFIKQSIAEGEKRCMDEAKDIMQEFITKILKTGKSIVCSKEIFDIYIKDRVESKYTVKNLNVEVIEKKIPVDSVVEKIVERIKSKGFDVYIVGGSVRDGLRGLPPKDIDLTTNATPEQVKNILKNYTVIDKGIQFGTVAVVIDGKDYEITTFRRESGYKDNRHPDKIEFAGNVIEDVFRRDFTFNGLLYDISGKVIDYVGGIKDLQEGIVRAIGDPNQRFTEDALRMMRAIRFASKMGFTIEPNTFEAIKNNAHLITNISAERINQEITKILESNNPHYFAMLYKTNLLDYIIPQLADTFRTPQNNPNHLYDVGTHTMVALQHTPNDLVVRLAVLLHDIGKPVVKTVGEDGYDHFYKHPEVSAEIAEQVLRNLKYENKIIEQVIPLIRYHDEIPTTAKGVYKLVNKLGSLDLAYKLVDVKLADISAQNPDMFDKKYQQVMFIKNTLDKISTQNIGWSLKDLAVNGYDIMSLGVKAGPKVGEILRYLLDKVMENPNDNNKETLIKYAREYLNSTE